MDYISWCHRVLAVLNEENHNPNLTPLDIGKKLFGENLYQLFGDFWSSIQGQALLHALGELRHLGFISERHSFQDITGKGQQLLADPHSYWEEICRIELDEEARQMLQFINQDSPKLGGEPPCVTISTIKRNEILARFELLPPERWDELNESYERVLIHTPYVLYKLGFARIHGGLHDCTSRGLSATYRGVVRETRRGETLETKFLDKLVDEWETPTVEFKQELHLYTKPQRAEFVKDVLALANTKASGERFLIVGFIDEAPHAYHQTPGSEITQERIEAALKQYSSPAVRVRYSTVDFRDGKVGKLEVFRDKHNLPYRATETVRSRPNGKPHLTAGAVYVRLNSLIMEADEQEIERLQQEGDRARRATQS